MRKITVEAEVIYSVMFDAEVEVPDEFNEEGITSAMERKIREQVLEAAPEYGSLLEVEDVGWYIK